MLEAQETWAHASLFHRADHLSNLAWKGDAPFCERLSELAANSHANVLTQ